MHNILSIIIDSKKKKIEVLKKNREAIASLAKNAPGPLSFKDAIRKEGKISIIGEIKQASPSTGILRKEFSYMDIAKTYDKLKIDALSIVTEEQFFLGKLNFIEEVKKIVTMPVLCKDFILDEVQILEARAVGSDAVLLIMGILSEEQFQRLYYFTKEMGMDALIEVHTEKELRKVLKAGVDIVGINNRNLHTLKVDLNKTEKLIPFVPSDVVKVSESGISSRKDVLLLKGMGVDAILVGKAIMEAPDIEEKIKELNIDA
ncbi:MAG: indole-3-glycerol phosphate synthase TrpC [Candidatus Omnitrophota bacterium]